jgi:hypothetical protein
MKKCFICLVALTLVSTIFMSCISVERAEEMEMKSEKLVINSMFNRDDFILIDTITASSDVVTYDYSSREYTGDSLKYGIISEPENLVVDLNLAVSTGRKPKRARGNALEIAKQNANYELIKKAEELGADTLLEPMYSIEKDATYVGKSPKKESYKVTVKAKALKLKIK